VLVVTHDSRIFDFGQRIIYMNDGVVVREEVPSQQGHLIAGAPS
jgi:ABC-type lipoprotein export system ATPase subunit